MKLRVVILLVFLFGSMAANAQTVYQTEKGTLSGAAFKIIFPENWQKKLIMYAHGYEFMGSAPRQSENPNFEAQMKAFLDKGFAIAASDYAFQGLALAQGVDDTEQLRKYFIEKYGKPDSVFIVGHSMGGGVTLATIENFSENYAGGLALCPLSGSLYLQCRKEYDIYATFNGLFPGIATPLKDIFDLDKPYQAQDGRKMFARAMEIKNAIFSKDSLLAVAFAHRYNLKPEDLPFSLFFNENVLRDIAIKAGGNPFDNMNTVYSGFPDDILVNEVAERLPASVSPEVVFEKYDRTGDIRKPVVLMHTIYDQLIPPFYGVTSFENMVARKGKNVFLTVKYTNGQGHCNFTQNQISQAFDELRAWVRTGTKAVPGKVN